MSQNLNVFIIQSNVVWENISLNLTNFEQKIAEAPKNTDLIVLPEMFSTGFHPFPEKVSETMSGTAVIWMKNIAKNTNSAICGSLVIAENDKFYNRFVFITPDGLLYYYDKRHLFRMSNEFETFTPGTTSIIINYKGWRIKPLICYDLRFPVWSRNKNDYDVLMYVANWPTSRQTQWHTLLLARAIENQAYVVAVNRIGTDGNNFEYAGDSLVIDPKGDVIQQFDLNTDKSGLATLNNELITKYRKTFPVHLDADKFEITD